MPTRKKPSAKAKTGRAYYYRMRTPEKRLETNVKLAAAMAVVVVVGLTCLIHEAFGPGSDSLV